MERTAVTICGVGLESCACTVKLVVPGAVGVPVMAPAALIDKPPGNELPLASENVYEGTPPAAETLALYEVPSTPLCKLVVVIDSAGVIAMERF